MSFKPIFVLTCFISLISLSTPGYAADIISCDSFENCPDGSEPLTNALLALEARMDTLEAEKTALEGLVTTLQEELASVVSDSHIIEASITRNIPGDFSTLTEAMRWIDKFHIGHDAVVTFQLADGHHVFETTFALGHRDGGRIHILGNLTDPTLVVLGFPNGGGLFVESTELGLINGVTIQGNKGDSGSASGSHGIFAMQNGVINLGNKVIVRDFTGAGVQAVSNSVILAPSVRSEDNGLDGFVAMDGGVIIADNARALNNGGAGFSANSGGIVKGPDITSTGNGGVGVSATHNSVLTADRSSIEGNTGDGILCAASYCSAQNASVVDNVGSFGFNVFWGGWLDVNGTVTSGHTFEGNMSREPSPIGGATIHDRGVSP